MLKIEQLNLVNGLDVTKMKLDDRLAIISATNKRIEELTSVMKDVASEMLTKEVGHLKEQLKAVVTLFDATPLPK